MADEDEYSVYDESGIAEIVNDIIKDHYRAFGEKLGLKGGEIDAKEKEALKEQVGEFYRSSFKQAYAEMAEKYPDSFTLPAPESVSQIMEVVNKVAAKNEYFRKEYDSIQETIFEGEEQEAQINSLIAELVYYTDDEKMSAGQRFDQLAEHGLEISEGRIRSHEAAVSEYVYSMLDSFPEYMQEHITPEDRKELLSKVSESRTRIAGEHNEVFNASLEKYYGAEMAELKESHVKGSHEFSTARFELKERALDNPAFAEIAEQDRKVFEGKFEQVVFDAAKELGDKIDKRISEKEKETETETEKKSESEAGKGKTSEVSDPSNDPAVAAAAGLRGNIQGELTQVEGNSPGMPGGGGEISRA